MGLTRVIARIGQSLLSPFHEYVEQQDRRFLRTQLRQGKHFLDKHGLNNIRLVAKYDLEEAKMLLHLEGMFLTSQETQFNKAVKELREFFLIEDNICCPPIICQNGSNIVKIGEPMDSSDKA